MSEDEKDSFREWHETRMKECGYPPAVVEKLRTDRERWFPKPKKK